MAKSNEEFLAQKCVFFTGHEKTLADLFTEKDFIDINGKKFILFNALLRAAKREFGILGFRSEIIQAPHVDNDWCASVVAEYWFKSDREEPVKWRGLADCRASSCAEGFEMYNVALAETRAKARALRDALGVEVCSKEELASNRNGGSRYTRNPNNPESEPIEPTQIMLIEKKFMGQMNVSLEDIEKLLGKKVATLKMLSKDEGAEIIRAFNKPKKK